MIADDQHARTEHGDQEKNVELLSLFLLFLQVAVRQNDDCEAGCKVQCDIEQCEPIHDHEWGHQPRSKRGSEPYRNESCSQAYQGQPSDKQMIAADRDSEHRRDRCCRHKHQRQEHEPVIEVQFHL